MKKRITASAQCKKRETSISLSSLGGRKHSRIGLRNWEIPTTVGDAIVCFFCCCCCCQFPSDCGEGGGASPVGSELFQRAGAGRRRKVLMVMQQGEVKEWKEKKQWRREVQTWSMWLLSCKLQLHRYRLLPPNREWPSSKLPFPLFFFAHQVWNDGCADHVLSFCFPLSVWGKQFPAISSSVDLNLGKFYFCFCRRKGMFLFLCGRSCGIDFLDFVTLWWPSITSSCGARDCQCFEGGWACVCESICQCSCTNSWTDRQIQLWDCPIEAAQMVMLAHQPQPCNSVSEVCLLPSCCNARIFTLWAISGCQHRSTPTIKSTHLLASPKWGTCADCMKKIMLLIWSPHHSLSLCTPLVTFSFLWI